MRSQDGLCRCGLGTMGRLAYDLGSPITSPWALNMQAYDVIVIGSGPAGQRAAIQAAKFGKRVALVEKREVIGGSCIATGAIPSKTMPRRCSICPDSITRTFTE